MSSSSLWATYMANQQKLVEIGKQIEEDKLRKAQQTADAHVVNKEKHGSKVGKT
jgi:hypothetical protein